jgi:hypothetical protein
MRSDVIGVSPPSKRWQPFFLVVFVTRRCLVSLLSLPLSLSFVCALSPSLSVSVSGVVLYVDALGGLVVV